MPSFDVYLVIHRKKREIDYRQCHDMKMQGFAIIEFELMLNDIDGKNIHFEAEERSLEKYMCKGKETFFYNCSTHFLALQEFFQLFHLLSPVIICLMFILMSLSKRDPTMLAGMERRKKTSV